MKDRTMQHTDYREDIFEAAKSTTAELREKQQSEDGEGFDCLDVEVWRRDNFPDLVRVEFILTLGGPTVSVLVDENDHVTYFHSWGCRADGSDLHQILMHDEDAAEWIGLAESYKQPQ